jgi:heme/copper-type cytochrome/quinol oxidase subunit 1
MNGDLAKRLGDLPAADKALLLTLAGFALLALLLGLSFGLATGLARGGFLPGLDDETGYRLMTLHGVDAFFYWLSLAQAFLLLVLASAGASRIASAISFADCASVFFGGSFFAGSSAATARASRGSRRTVVGRMARFLKEPRWLHPMLRLAGAGDSRKVRQRSP